MTTSRAKIIAFRLFVLLCLMSCYRFYRVTLHDRPSDRRVEASHASPSFSGAHRLTLPATSSPPTLNASLLHRLTLPTTPSPSTLNASLLHRLTLPNTPSPPTLNASLPPWLTKPITPNPLSPIFDMLLRRWDAIADKAGIKYSLTFGTYLGWLRDRTYIPYDQDMDVHIGREGLSKLLLLVAQPWCTFNTDLKTQPLQGDEIRLVIYAAHEAQVLESQRPRYDCSGKPVSFAVDSCSFNGPLARLILSTRNSKWWKQGGGKTRHLDIFLYKYEPGKKTRHMHQVNTSSCGQVVSYFPSSLASELPPVQPCTINDVNASCFERVFGHSFMKCKYGPGYVTPNKRWNARLQKWVPGHV